MAVFLRNEAGALLRKNGKFLTKPADQNELAYGVQWDITAPSPVLTRIGNLAMHVSLPIQSAMKRCLVLDNAEVKYYLDENDSTKLDSGFNANLGGQDGQFMVEIPQYYQRFAISGNIAEAWISFHDIPGFQRVPKAYISATEATVDRVENKLACVVSLDPKYRGGNNNSSWDSEDRSLLGMPASSITRDAFESLASARGAGWTTYDIRAHERLFWLRNIEYANFDSQLAFNANLTAEGYKQGGSGPGVTSVVSADWTTYNSRYGFVPCGFTASLGGKSGVKSLTLAGFPGMPTVSVPSYRGVENPFGHLLKWMGGVNIVIAPDPGASKAYVATDLNYNNDSEGYAYIGDIPRSDNYIKEILLGATGSFLPAVSGGSSSTFFCDYAYTSIPAEETVRGLLVGGAALHGAAAGFGCVYSSYGPSYAHANIGSRLCLLPEGR